MAPTVRVEIDELVLHGFERAHRDGIADALRAELAVGLAGFRPAASRGVAHLDAGSFDVPEAASPATTGQAIARQVEQVIA